ncbi:MAG: hypothetical protein RSD01_04235 [Ruthenibacterium sp.]
MTWQTPKTNWTAQDCFSLTPDAKRIQNNLAVLCQTAKPLYLDVVQCNFGQYTTAAWAVAPFWNDMADVLTALETATAWTEETPVRRVTENGPVWTAADANRIERSMGSIAQNLQAQQNNLPRLGITLGGGIFAANF